MSHVLRDVPRVLCDVSYAIDDVCHVSMYAAAKPSTQRDQHL